DILRRSNQFRLFRSDVLAAESDTGLGAVQTYGAEYVSMIAQELLQSLRSASPIYTDMLNQGKGGADSLQAREREIGRTALAVPGTYDRDFERPRDAGVDLLAIGSGRDGPVVQVAFAIPGRELTPRRIGSRFAYQVRLRLALLDDAGQAVTTVDTLRTFLAARSLGPNDMLLGHLPV